ncbi:unnamed protein product [Malus baccata var. baccata]
MSAFRQFFKRLTGGKAGGTSAAAVEPKVKVELDVSSSHPRHVVKFVIHPEDEESVKKMIAAKPPGIMAWLSNINLLAGSADLLWKSGKTLLKAKERGLKEALKGEGCCFGQQSQGQLGSLVDQSHVNTARLAYLEQVAEHYAKYGVTKGSPPPPVRPLPPSKQEANGNNNGKVNGNGKGNGQGQGKGEGEGNGNGKGKGNGNGNGSGNGGPPALPENDTLPEPFELPF